MVNQDQFNELSQFEAWRLSQIVLQECRVFSSEREWIINRYGEEVLDPKFFSYAPPHVTRKVISEFHLAIENRVRDFNDHLYDLICKKFKWCERRDLPLIENIEIVALLIDIFGTNGVAALILLLIKRKFLDKLCNCKVRSS
ncbi:MAG: hypothetical protein LBE81_01545 [Azonexus sp.]|jgi:hypothetical protein|uniref:hypothetical protein n=1 Tax=Azonexus sp. TaxID=1872668 RepID=UPI002817A9A8|nr:hypothetical protein [Azonexus sp.]MDR0775311.1 hypothetical protein [Azonexus sp.]